MTRIGFGFTRVSLLRVYILYLHEKSCSFLYLYSLDYRQDFLYILYDLEERIFVNVVLVSDNLSSNWQLGNLQFGNLSTKLPCALV